MSLVSVSKDGLHIVDHSISGEYEKKKISASLVTDVADDSSCSASWLAKTFVVPKIVEPPVDTPATRGSMFHKVMEEFFQLEPEHRTPDNLKECVSRVKNSDQFNQLAQIPDANEWLVSAIKNYFSMGGNPRDVNIADVEINGWRKKGLEVFVSGKIGDTERQALGFIDRVSVSQKGGLIVDDYKTGAKADVWNPKTKGKEGWKEQRQQIIYSMLLEQSGYEVNGARLIYPVVQKVVKADIKNEQMREQVVKDVEKADERLRVMAETNTFEFTPSFLCSWCPLVNVCGSAIKIKGEKGRLAREQQPTRDQLEDGLIF